MGRVARFGARYGTRVRRIVEEIEEKEKRVYQCPKCSANAVRRIGTGIWECRKCEYKFAGGAYVPRTK